MENTLVRTEPCSACGAKMLWTQNAWPPDHQIEGAYRCPNGHVIDPDATRQCPSCGIHDTYAVAEGEGTARFSCHRCGTTFTFPR
jgi:DNA-directed RNA polymerase subunit RPC12/RpoP